MGYKFGVYNWECDSLTNMVGAYAWVCYYQGNSVFKALYYFFKLRIKGSKCLKLDWRP